MMKSASSDKRTSLLARAGYLFALVIMNAKRTPQKADNVIAEIENVVTVYEKYGGQITPSSHVLEIGFGARPHRAFAFQKVFSKVTAVDLEHPVFQLWDFIPALRSNGVLSAVKSTTRAVVFDRGEWRDFHADMARSHEPYKPSLSNLVIADAASDEFWRNNPGPYDLIFSTDVFEHIPTKRLKNLLKNIKCSLKSGGVCITRPCVFTGITGGHLPDWYEHKIQTNSSDTAWSHLWRSDFQVDTFLNRLERSDYINLFLEAGFEVLEDRAMVQDLGRHHLKNVEHILGDRWDDYELFSNRVEFVIK